MKNLLPWILSLVLAVALAAVYSKQENTTRDLREEITRLEKAASSSERRVSKASSGSTGSRSAASNRQNSTANAQSSADADLGESLRKIMENPIGKAMMSEEGRIKAARIYRGLIKEMDLTDEEEEYFTGLLSADVGAEDAVGLQLFNAKTDQERLAILEKVESDKEARREEIKKFLNNEEDYQRFRHYQDRRREYEQLSTIRSAISESGSPLSDPQEKQLIEAMYAARDESGMLHEWEGREGMNQFARPGVADRFTNDWAEMQEILATKTDGILEPPQQEAFTSQQNQIRDLALFGIKMAEGMMKSKFENSGASDAE
ncbi:MAG: hypothetical protein ACON38_18045 [Akkermansiaceae bacterium]